jgi:hypothetical protein
MYLVVFMICVPPVFGGLAWAEVVSWPVLTVTLANGTVHNAMYYVSYAVSVIGLLIFSLVPGSKRVLRLEQTHREFKISMNDVAAAFYMAFTADRNNMFMLPEKFDGTRERFEFLKSLPEFADFEPEILTLAAQMSYQARQLAKAFSTETVARAEDFLRQRKHELDRGEERVQTAQAILERVRSEARALALSEQIQDSQITRIIEAIHEQLAPLGFQVIAKPSTVVEFVTATPAE